MQIIKNSYTTPEIQKIGLDNDISLILQSEPPIGPGEDWLGYNSDLIHQETPLS
jgi:hypothetical protein